MQAIDTLVHQSDDTLTYRYSVYGTTIISDIELGLPTSSSNTLTQIRLQTASATTLSQLVQDHTIIESSSSWYQYSRMEGGSSYVRWDEVGEFFVEANGRKIICRKFDNASNESFQVYLLGQAISFALIRQGFEPLHATAVVVGNEAIAFLGKGGFGKSTLAASFLVDGHRLLTDDVLILQPQSSGFLAHPGPGRLKLFPTIAEAYLADRALGVPMNPFTKKTIIPLSSDQLCGVAVPLRAIYAIEPGKEVTTNSVKVEALSSRDAFLLLLENTFNYRMVDTDRLRRQFAQNERLVAEIGVSKLSYPRVLSIGPEVRSVLLSANRINSTESE